MWLFMGVEVKHVFFVVYFGIKSCYMAAAEVPLGLHLAWKDFVLKAATVQEFYGLRNTIRVT